MITAKIKPALRYHGAKWMLAPWIISHFPEHNIYVEAYGGSAAVLLRKCRAYAEVYNDVCSEVVNYFEVLRCPLSAKSLESALRLTPFSREVFEDIRDSECNIEKARKTVIRSYMGFGSNSISTSSGFRSNSNRSGSTPAHDWMRYPDRIKNLTKRLQGVVIEKRPALELIKAHDSPETLHYVDPPYLPKTRTARNGYRHDMTPSDHFNLSELLHSCKGMVVLSGYPSDIYDDLYQDWHKVSRDALADGAKPRIECLWLNNKAMNSLNSERLL